MEQVYERWQNNMLYASIKLCSAVHETTIFTFILPVLQLFPFYLKTDVNNRYK